MRMLETLKAVVNPRGRRASWPNPLHLWDEDPEFSRLYTDIGAHTIVDKLRCFMLYQFARHVERLPGDVAEVGVYRGGTAKLLASVFQDSRKKVHLFDTFVGMPVPDGSKDLHQQGDFRDTSLEEVRCYLSECAGVVFHPGLFPATAEGLASRQFCLVHVDADLHDSVFAACEFFYPRLVAGGMMVFDDYGWRSCPGAKLAVDTFFAHDPIARWYLPTGQCVVCKR